METILSQGQEDDGSSAIRNLQGMLRELRGDPSSDCAGVVTALARRDTLAELLNTILTDAALLGQIASRSYRHVNMFDKIVLVGSSDPEDYRLTLHLWQPPYPAHAFAQEMIHSHRFSFWSAVITGTLAAEFFQERGESSGARMMRKYKYLPEANRGSEFKDFYEFTGYAHLGATGVRELHAGDSYYLEASEIHRILLRPWSITCTLVLRGPRLTNHAFVYSTKYPDRSVSLENKVYSAGQLAIRLGKLLSALESV